MLFSTFQMKNNIRLEPIISNSPEKELRDKIRLEKYVLRKRGHFLMKLLQKLSTEQRRRFILSLLAATNELILRFTEAARSAGDKTH